MALLTHMVRGKRRTVVPVGTCQTLRIGVLRLTIGTRQIFLPSARLL